MYHQNCHIIRHDRTQQRERDVDIKGEKVRVKGDGNKDESYAGSQQKKTKGEIGKSPYFITID